MATRPSQGGSNGTWGSELNAWLDQFANADGTLKAAAVLAALGGANSAPVLFDTSNFFVPCTDSFTTRTLIGIDRVNDRMLVAGSSSLFQSSDFGATLSTDKGQPSTSTANLARKLVMFKGNYYFAGVDSVSGKAAVWKAAPAAGNTAFSWGSPVFTASTGATSVIATAMNVITDANGNDLAIMFGEYADPTGGPTMWRTTDGTTWTAVLSPSVGSPTTTGVRHFHCVAQDPYNPANVYASAGDGITKPIWKSTDYGVTWSVIVTDSNFQGVQISFTTNWVFFAGDSARGTCFVMDRATNTCHWLPGNHRFWPVASPWFRAGGHAFTDGACTNGSKTFTSATAGFGTTFDKNDVGREVLLPGALLPNTFIAGVSSSTSVQLNQNAQATLSAQPFILSGDEFYYSAFYGIVDPATGFYYCTANDNSSGGNRSGLFVHTGQDFLLLDVHEASVTGVNQVSAEHFIYNGKLWSAGKSHVLGSATRTMLTP